MQSRNGTLGRIAGGRKHLVIYCRSRPSLLDGQRTAGGKEDGAIRPQQACAGNGIPSGAFDQVRAAQLGWDDAGLRGRSWHGDEPRRILRDRLLQTSTFVILSLRSPKRDGRRKNKQSEDGTRHLPKPFGAHSIPPHTAPCCAEPAMASRMCICSTIHVLLLLFAFAFCLLFLFRDAFARNPRPRDESIAWLGLDGTAPTAHPGAILAWSNRNRISPGSIGRTRDDAWT